MEAVWAKGFRAQTDCQARMGLFSVKIFSGIEIDNCPVIEIDN
jgi:hypothetical protein